MCRNNSLRDGLQYRQAAKKGSTDNVITGDIPEDKMTYRVNPKTGEKVSLLGYDETIVMAPTGQWRAQLPHSTPSVSGMQFSFIQTALPICTEDFSAASIFKIAPAGHTSEHRVHSGRQ